MARPRPRRAIESPIPARREQVVAEGSARRFPIRLAASSKGRSWRSQPAWRWYSESSDLGVGSASATTRSRVAVSFSQDRWHAVRLNGATVKGKIYVFVRSSRGLRRVDFYLGMGAEAALAEPKGFHGSIWPAGPERRCRTTPGSWSRDLTTRGGVDLAESEDLQWWGRLHCRQRAG